MGMDCKSIGLRLRWFKSSLAHKIGMIFVVARIFIIWINPLSFMYLFFMVFSRFCSLLSKLKLFTLSCSFLVLFALKASAYPIFARQYFSSPREVSGRIACSYCHLAQKPIKITMPQSVFPNTVFEATVKVPYDKTIKQLSAQGKKVGLNIGTILILPEGFTLAPLDRIPVALKEKINGLSYLPYNNANKTTFMIGPVSGDKYNQLVFPVLAPEADIKTAYLKSDVYVAGNRGRGQLYPSGEKSNNNLFVSSITGRVSEIKPGLKGGFDIIIESEDSNIITESVGAGATIIVEPGQQISVGQALTTDPNVGGYGQAETEILLQNPIRVQGLLLFSFFIVLAQIALVLKKKQFEKVQLFEMNF